MGSFVLSPAAQADLEDIWAYSEATWGPDQAERYLLRVRRAVETVAADPRRGRPCDEIRPGYFKFPAGSHLLFYRLAPSGVDIVRVLHQRMDFDRQL